MDDERQAEERTDEARGGDEEAGEPAGSALVGEHGTMISTSGTEVERVNKVGVEAAGMSPAAIERFRILREMQIRRQG